MAYIVVKDFNSQGCICFSSDNVKVMKHTLGLLNSVLDINKFQVILLNDPNSYGEYAPYNIINDLNKFISKVLSMDVQSSDDDFID